MIEGVKVVRRIKGSNKLPANLTRVKHMYNLIKMEILKGIENSKMTIHENLI